MSTYATSGQIDILVEILEDSIDKSLNSSIEAEYENWKKKRPIKKRVTC